MTDYIETKTKDGTLLRIEVESLHKTGAGFTRAAVSADEAGEAAQDAYKRILDTIRACANGVVDTMGELDAPPSAASIDFAIKIDAEAVAMVAKSAADAQFKVSLSWKQAETGQDEEK